MKNIFDNILSEKQRELLPLIKPFFKEFYLAGGTAIALQIGHRKSIDFDLFSNSEIHPQKITNRIFAKNYELQSVLAQSSDEYSIVVNGVKLTFLYFPFEIEPKCKGDFMLPSLLDLAAMKAYALGRRSKWKDYVDLYFLLKDYFSLQEIIAQTEAIFRQGFNSKLFREQLCYFEDMDYSEGIDFANQPVYDEIIKEFLVKQSTQKGEQR